jgi:hypothetical protein
MPASNVTAEAIFVKENDDPSAPCCEHYPECECNITPPTAGEDGTQNRPPAPGGNVSPQTGDNMNIALYAMLSLFSLSIICALRVFADATNKKRRYEKNKQRNR